MNPWTALDIPSQVGRHAVITGTGGLGYQTAVALARAGAHVIIAGRNSLKGTEAVARIRESIPNAIVRFEPVDLASLRSIAAFGGRLRAGREGLDLLINNAAVMAPPQRQTTSDGFELQFGTNYLGHFALTAQLLPLLRSARHARVVNVSSVAARNGKINFDDLQAEHHYKPMVAYGQSKLANLLFSFELQRRSEAGGWGVSSIAAHPGLSRTELIVNGAGRMSFPGFMRTFLGFLFQPAAQGALPSLFAATSPKAAEGAYYGPDKLGETRGAPALAKVPMQAQDAHTATRLWDLSEQLTGATYPSTLRPAQEQKAETSRDRWRSREEEKKLLDTASAGVNTPGPVSNRHPVDIRIIQLMLRHASIQLTQRYLNVTDEELRRGLGVRWGRCGWPQAGNQQVIC